MGDFRCECVFKRISFSKKKVIINYFGSVIKVIRILSIILLTALYCFTIGIDTKSLIGSDIQTNNQENHCLTISTLFSPFTSETENSLHHFNNIPSPSFNNLLVGSWAITKTTERHYESIFSQYTGFSINFLIHHRKSDIMFPFHYFW